MIQVDVTMDGKADLASFAHNLGVNIRRSQSKLAHKVTEVAWFRARENAPVWQGGLKSKIYAKFMKKMGEVFVSNDLENQAKARANEFGVKPHFLDRDEYPDIDAWATEKGYVYRGNPNLVKVGGTGTRLGKQNRFFEPAFIQTQNQIPMIMAEVIREALMKTRG